MSVFDWLISLGAVVLMFGQGWWFARRQKTAEDYFLGGRRMNWLVVGLSIFATTFSPLSFMGLPREAAFDDYHLYLAILFIPLVVAPLVGWLVVPVYHRLHLTSAYEYLERRFSRGLRRSGSMLYALYLLGWMGSMLYATSLSVQAALGLGEEQRIGAMLFLGAVTAVYTTVGGYQATVWTGVAKSAILFTVIVAVLSLAIGRVAGGLAGVIELGIKNDKFAMFVPRFDPTTRANFFSACAFGLFVYGSAAVTGQASVQRYVSMPSVAAARRSLAVNGIGTALGCLLFFFLGTTMFAFYTQNPTSSDSIWPTLRRPDQLIIHFVGTELPYVGLMGLLLAGLLTTVMGSLSSGLNSLSALVTCDWLPGQTLDVRRARMVSALFGVGAAGVALVAPYLGPRVFDIIIGISGAFLGPLLGLFLLGLFVPRANTAGAAFGVAAGIICLVSVFATPINAWWYGACTCVPTLAVGVLASFLFPRPPAEKLRGLLALETRVVE